ncbi:MAG: anhydro-N-acetylmuramic acid kinase, partial [Cyclobacteriaceae bacterium]|nr:anhydro-N-acetylmuramic acid kinase [Cyclobacteriaceae bacterium]
MNQLEGRGHYKCIGTMSGTSLDGLDLVYCEFVKSGDQWSFKILNSKSLSYDAPLRDDLFNAPSFDSERLMLLDRSIGKFFADAIQTFIRENSLQPDFISSHGHTIFHQPESLLTLQIGNGYVIAANTGIPVITDFRSLDVALSGQGAPLVPIGDHFLFSDYDIRLNLGGISNISLEKGNQTI